MMPDATSGHLKLCRELYSQLRRTQAHQDHRESAASTTLPINFPMFVRNFELYIQWAERNSKVVDIAARRPPVRVNVGAEPA
jgi:hypothetical protein